MCMDCSVHKDVDDAIRHIFGDSVKIKSQRAVSGGDINESYHLVLTNGEEVFSKQNRSVEARFFQAEAHGIEAIRETGANVPEILAYGGTYVKFILFRYVESGSRGADYWRALGEMLGRMHRFDTGSWVQNGYYGFHEDNFIGTTLQKNTPIAGWIDFFRDARLGVQMKLADHYFDSEDRQLCQKLLDHLADFLIEPQFPSLLHGDLWGGNVMPDAQGKPMLIDPAVYVGHHEADIAMTELFGRFPQAFYDAYSDVIPMDPEYEDRRDIYNLYHMLNHLNLFGGHYLSSARRILKRYVS